MSEIQGFYNVSHNLSDLIVHIRNLRGIIKKELSNQTLSVQEKNYLKETNVTDVAREIIRINL